MKRSITTLSGMPGVWAVLARSFPCRFFKRLLFRRARPPRPAPYTAERPPASIGEAHERLRWLNRRRREDWLVNWPKEYERFAAMSDEQYRAARKQLRGHVGTVIRTDIVERAFLNAWIRAESDRISRERKSRRRARRKRSRAAWPAPPPKFGVTSLSRPPVPRHRRGRTPTRQAKS